ncbi:MAG: hypothetical protein IT578_08895 [Verrucomicrobiae bacterium]|nr:hypothetical protein [Verrucomicrobiae bacterium]
MRKPNAQRRTLQALQLQWGWITPGTCASHRGGQWEAHRDFLARPTRPESRHLLLVHCGWWLDADASAWLRDLTRRNPEPDRAHEPCRPRDLAFLRTVVRRGRIEMVAYPYATCVAEATTGEGLLRAFRFSLGIMERHLGARARVLMNHDAVYGLDWGCPQMPQIARLLGRSLILAGEEGTLVAPDGTKVRAFGSDDRWYMALAKARLGRRPVFFSSELHDHLRFLEDLAARRLPLALPGPMNGVGLETYLTANRTRRKISARQMGSKSWYGGVTDSLQIEQCTKGVELRLPAIEAAALLGGRLDRAARARIAELWKGAFVLMDTSIHWQCHDYRRHYLPRAVRFAREAADFERCVLGSRRKGRRVFAFNPTPWRRDLIVETSRGAIRMARGTPGWGAAEAIPVRARRVPSAGGARRLEVGAARYDLNALGEVIRATVGGRGREFGGLGRLVEFREKPSQEKMRLSEGETLCGFEGNASLSCEVEIPSRWNGAIFTAEVLGEAFLLQVERRGESKKSEWHALHNLHWGGKGLPNSMTKVGPVEIHIGNTRRVRLTLWTLAEGRLAVRGAKLRPSRAGRGTIALSCWEARILSRIEVARAVAREARVTRDLGILKEVCFEGELPSCRWSLSAALREGNRALEFRLRLRFLKPTRLGLTTPPFSENEGSLLGAQCERPYVPGIAVVFPLPGRARYFSDKPWSLEEAFRDSPRTWHTDRRDWWLGLSPFLGMNLAVADWGRGKLALLTRGLKHFFRWRRDGAESLGLSFGATVIHPMTQGHSAPRSSRFFPLIGRRDHDPYVRTRFLRAQGICEFHYAVRPVLDSEEGLALSWRAAQEFALPPSLFRADRIPRGLAGGTACDAPDAAISALETDEKARFVARLVNLEGRAKKARVELPGLGKATQVALPPFAVRETFL